MGEHKRKKKFKIPSAGRNKAAIWIIIIAVFAIAGIDYLKKAKGSLLKEFPVARSKGDVDAPLQIVEFADFQCSHCAEGAKLLKQFDSEYPGSMRIVLRYFPLSGLNSMFSAIYAQCAADQQRFWPFADRLFEQQNDWRQLRNIGPFFSVIARDAGLDIQALDACVVKDSIRDVVDRDKNLGESYMIKSTPTYFINEEMIVGIKELEQYLSDYFKKRISVDIL